jgi:hypothetical protein
VLLLKFFACTLKLKDTEDFNHGVANVAFRNFGKIHPERKITTLFSLQVLNFKAPNDFLPSARKF